MGKYIQVSSNHTTSGVQGSMAWVDYLLSTGVQTNTNTMPTM